MANDRNTPQKNPLRSQAGRIGALAMHSRNDSRKVTQRARDTFMARFYAQVDANNELSESERERRAELAKKEYFARLALKSAKARGRAASKRAIRKSLESGRDCAE